MFPDFPTSTQSLTFVRIILSTVSIPGRPLQNSLWGHILPSNQNKDPQMFLVIQQPSEVQEDGFLSKYLSMLIRIVERCVILGAFRAPHMEWLSTWTSFGLFEQWLFFHFDNLIRALHIYQLTRYSNYQILVVLTLEIAEAISEVIHIILVSTSWTTVHRS